MPARNSDNHMFISMSKMTATTGSEEAARNGGGLPHLAEMTVSRSAARHSFYPLTGMCMAIYGGTWRVTSRLGLGSGQGSGRSQTRFQRRSLSSNRRSQLMPWRITLTFRFGSCQLLRC